MIASSILLALAIVAPKDGETVPTIKDGHKAYLRDKQSERFLRMDNLTDRRKFLCVGSMQMPLKLEWSGDTNAVYGLTVSTDGMGDENFVLTNRTKAYLTNLQLGSRYQLTVRNMNSGESAMACFLTEDVAPRLLRAEGVANFRDFGGWRTTDGRAVRENMIYRSAGLRGSSSKPKGGLFSRGVEPGPRRVTDAGIATLRNEFRIRTELELRTPQETEGMTASVLGADVTWMHIPFAAYDLIDNTVRGREPFAKIFRVFLDEKNYPILVHCSGGRDRTGTLAFLLNGLLGVSEEDLCRDWEMSVFSDVDVNFTSDRIVRLMNYLKTFPGQTLQEKIESYARSCGVTDDEFGKFRALMLK